MVKMRLEFALPHGRIVGNERVPLYLRVDLEDGQLAKATLGIEQKGGTVNWQLSLLPTALTWAADCVERALLTAQPPGLQSNVVDPGKGAP